MSAALVQPLRTRLRVVAVVVSLMAAALWSTGPADAARRTTKRSTAKTASPFGPDFVEVTLDGRRVYVTKVAARLLQLVPKPTEKQLFGSLKLDNGSVYEVYGKRDAQSLVMVCVESVRTLGTSRACTSTVEQDAVTSSGSSGLGEEVEVRLLAPPKGNLTVHSVKGDVGAQLIARIDGVGAWYVHVGADLSPFGVESSESGVAPYLPFPGTDRAAFTDLRVVASIDGTWRIVEPVFGPRRVLCLDGGDPTRFESCNSDTLRLKYIGLSPRRDLNLDWTTIVACRNAIRSVAYKDAEGRVIPAEILASTTPFLIVKFPAKATLLLTTPKGKVVTVERKPFTSISDSLADAMAIFDELPSC